MPCLLPNQQKNQLWNPCCHWVVQMTKKSPTWIQSWSQGGPKSIKNLLKSKSGPKMSCWVSLGASGSTKWCPGTPKSHPGTSKCTCQASEQVSQVAKMEPRVYQIVNQLLARWRGVNNWIYIYIYIYIVYCIAHCVQSVRVSEKVEASGFVLPPSPAGASWHPMYMVGKHKVGKH